MTQKDVDELVPTLIHLREVEAAVRATLLDMIATSTGCRCCDNMSEHQYMIHRALARFPPELWPIAAQIPTNQLDWFSKDALTRKTLSMLIERKVA